MREECREAGPVAPAGQVTPRETIQSRWRSGGGSVGETVAQSVAESVAESVGRLTKSASMGSPGDDGIVRRRMGDGSRNHRSGKPTVVVLRVYTNTANASVLEGAVDWGETVLVGAGRPASGRREGAGTAGTERIVAMVRVLHEGCGGVRRNAVGVSGTPVPQRSGVPARRPRSTPRRSAWPRTEATPGARPSRLRSSPAEAHGLPGPVP